MNHLKNNPKNGWYLNFNLFFSYIKLYIFFYTKGYRAELHTDTIHNRTGLSYNLIFRCCSGGVFYCEKTVFSLNLIVFQFYIFNGFKHKHSVSELKNGFRICFNFKILTNKN